MIHFFRPSTSLPMSSSKTRSACSASATRTLKQVTLADAEQADLVFDELMGNEVEGRKKWIMANATKAALDV